MKFALLLALLIPTASFAAEEKRNPDPCKKEREMWCKDIKLEDQDKLRTCLKSHFQDLKGECRDWAEKLRPKMTRSKWKQQIAPENKPDEPEEKK